MRYSHSTKKVQKRGNFACHAIFDCDHNIQQSKPHTVIRGDFGHRGDFGRFQKLCLLGFQGC